MSLVYGLCTLLSNVWLWGAYVYIVLWYCRSDSFRLDSLWLHLSKGDQFDMSYLQTACKNAGVFLTEGHFVYTSGRHGPDYVNEKAIYPDTQLVSAACKPINTSVGHGREFLTRKGA